MAGKKRSRAPHDRKPDASYFNLGRPLIMQLGGFEQVVKFFDKTQERGGIRMLEKKPNLIRKLGGYKEAKRKIRHLRTCDAHAEVERMTRELQNYTRRGERAPSTVSSVQIHANAILEAAKASIRNQMRQARASDSPETWYHWSSCPSEAVFDRLFGTTARTHKITPADFEEMLGWHLEGFMTFRRLGRLCGSVNIVWRPEQLVFMIAGYYE
ncbi:hypothetical protein E4T47_00773 [Aureobasidium subglaciale]|nr:hypothetical protein E4T47_00773 [Aureobasidium subglaciale]